MKPNGKLQNRLNKFFQIIIMNQQLSNVYKTKEDKNTIDYLKLTDKTLKCCTFKWNLYKLVIH